MLVLSNGQTITVSSERVRYHATRLNICISRQTPHEALYALIDILVQNEKDSSSFVYSGYTLAELASLNLLPEEDRQSFSEWLLKSHIRYEIEGARRRLIYDTLPTAVVSLAYPEKLYSRLQRLVRDMPVSVMPASQWQQTLANLQQQGICQEELYWSGVMAWLDKMGKESDPKVAKQTILDNIDFFQIRLRVTNELLANKNDVTKLNYRNKYRHVSLYGGEDYREWLVSLPEYMQSYFGPHFTERNVLLHIRTKTRFDAKGRKLLFIEEIQSDWHQVTYKNCSTLSKVQVPLAPYRKSWVSLGLKLMLIHAAREGFEGVAWSDGPIQARRYGAGLSAVQRIYDEIIPRSLLKMSKHWNGMIRTTEIETKVPWFRIEEIKHQNRIAAQHGFVKLPKYSKQDVLSLLETYHKTESIQTPVFMLPAEMSDYINSTGLPLFGEKSLN